MNRCFVACIAVTSLAGCSPGFPAGKTVFPEEKVLYVDTLPSFTIAPLTSRATPQYFDRGTFGKQQYPIDPNSPIEKNVRDALVDGLKRRGLQVVDHGEVEVTCDVSKWVSSGHNYGGRFGHNDLYCRVDLGCQLSRIGKTVWQGRLSGGATYDVSATGFGAAPPVFSGSGSITESPGYVVCGVAVEQIVSQIISHTGDYRTNAQDLLATEAALHDKDVSKQLSAIYYLGVRGSRADAPKLVAFLADAEPRLRSAAAIALGMLGDHDTWVAFASRLATEQKEVSQWGLITGIYMSNDRQALHALSQVQFKHGVDVDDLLEDLPRYLSEPEPVVTPPAPLPPAPPVTREPKANPQAKPKT